MRAGTLRHRVTIQSPTRTESAVSGEMVLAWVDVAADVPAAVIPRTAGEREESAQQVHRVTHEVSLRYRSGLTSDMRLKYGTRILAIASIINVDERNREHRLVCSEVR